MATDKEILKLQKLVQIMKLWSEIWLEENNGNSD